MTYKIWLVDSNQIFCHGLKVVLDGSGVSIVRQEATIDLLLEPTEKQSELPDAILVGLTSIRDGDDPDDRDLRNLCKLFWGIPTIILAEWISISQFVSVVKSGASGYLSRKIAPDGLKYSLLLAMTGEKVLPSEFADILVSMSDDHQMEPSGAEGGGHAGGSYTDSSDGDGINGADCREPTAREMEVLRLIAEGCPNKLIARKMGIGLLPVSKTPS